MFYLPSHNTSIIWPEIELSSRFFRPVAVDEAMYNIAKETPNAPKTVKSASSVSIPGSQYPPPPEAAATRPNI